MDRQRDGLLGWEGLYRVAQVDISKKTDVIALFVHHRLVNCHSFRCLGVQKLDAEYTTTDPVSELMPPNWTSSPSYDLVYNIPSESDSGKQYVLTAATHREIGVIFTLAEKADRSIMSRLCDFIVDDVVLHTTGRVSDMIPSYERLWACVDEGVGILLGRAPKPAPAPAPTRDSQTAEATTVILPNATTVVVGPSPLARYPQVSPLGVGAADLDPLGIGRIGPSYGVGPYGVGPSFGGGGGMLFNPFAGRDSARHGIPGNVPPGVRFDPFGPPGSMDPNGRMWDSSSDFL